MDFRLTERERHFQKQVRNFMLPASGHTQFDDSLPFEFPREDKYRDAAR